ncbi:DeoR family transcriptional regulator of aga operon [Naumannella halotolerans]|uniref:DeoR family transcriptional regulator of aga operon n=2 Tax=Naumannella halotolerans TaxID=993414 RepID=A0A4R7J6U8_9ACTN|nr:DeoR family transcriptional regulator of aga operon [Naumannella halotolerans]
MTDSVDRPDSDQTASDPIRSGQTQADQSQAEQSQAEQTQADRTRSGRPGDTAARAGLDRQTRLEAILDLLGEAGTVEVNEIVETFDVSPATARRDLQMLADRHLLARTRGGATAQSVAYDLPLRYKREQHATEKSRIAAAALDLVSPGARIGLSGGTTTTTLASALAVRTDLSVASRKLTVVTNAINIAAQLAVRQHIRVVVTGGVVQSSSYELVGPYSDQLLQQLSLDIAFLGTNAIGPDGPAVHDEAEARVNGQMALRAEQAWLLADSSKIGIRAFARMGELGWYRGVITDDGLSTDQRALLDSLGLDVLIA